AGVSRGVGAEGLFPLVILRFDRRLEPLLRRHRRGCRQATTGERPWHRRHAARLSGSRRLARRFSEREALHRGESPPAIGAALPSVSKVRRQGNRAIGPSPDRSKRDRCADEEAYEGGHFAFKSSALSVNEL